MRAWILLVAPLMLTTFGYLRAEEPPTADCDTDAGPSVRDDKIDAGAAIPACQKAVQQFPTSLRLIYQLGRSYNAGKRYTDAIEAFRKAANEEFGPAQIDLGGMYWLGRGVPRNYAEAVKWNRLAADQEIAPAQYNLGSAYEHGRGVTQNSEMAAKWYSLAANQGFAMGQWALGSLYERGYGVEQSYSQAVDWYRKAAEHGLSVAQYNLGLMYETGRGVSKDTAQALILFRSATAQGYKPAADEVSKLEAARDFRDRSRRARSDK
jgi:TPR repeat protein